MVMVVVSQSRAVPAGTAPRRGTTMFKSRKRGLPAVPESIQLWSPCWLCDLGPVPSLPRPERPQPSPQLQEGDQSQDCTGT